MSKSMKRLVAVLFLGAVVTIGISLFVMTMGALDSGVDMSGSDYEEQYNTVTDVSLISISMMEFLPIIIGVIALLIGVVGLKKFAKIG